MTDCRRCYITIKFENNLCFDENGIPHDIRKCKSTPNHIWCPAHRELFHQRNPCKHYTEHAYKPGQNEEFFINLINQNYSSGDWFVRRNRIRKSGNSMKKSVCTKCSAPVHHMSKKQQQLHEKMHKDEENNQNVLSEFF